MIAKQYYKEIILEVKTFFLPLHEFPIDTKI